MFKILGCFTKRVLVAVIGVALLAGPALAAQKTAVYNVYAGGVRVVQAELKLDFGRTTYRTELSANTRGFLGALVPWRGTFHSKGGVDQKKYVVRDHRSVSTWRGADDVAHYKYSARGDFLSLKMTENGIDVTPPKIDPALTRGTTDVLTATFNMLAASDKSGECKGSQDVFDSKRRFTLTYQPTGRAVLGPSRYTFYQGPAWVCTAEVIPKGGAWGKKPRGWLSIQEQGRLAGALPTLWVAKVAPDLPPLPVKIMIKTAYGTLFMHLAELK